MRILALIFIFNEVTLSFPFGVAITIDHRPSSASSSVLVAVVAQTLI